MDGHRFDTLAKSFADLSRRQLLKALAGAVGLGPGFWLRNASGVSATRMQSDGCASYTVTVYGTVLWNDTDIDIASGSVVQISANGIIYIAGSDPGRGPEGIVGCIESSPSSPAPGLTCVSLVGRIGNGAPFEIGAGITLTAQTDGRLYLTINDSDFGDNRGSWTALVSVCPGTSGTCALDTDCVNGKCCSPICVDADGCCTDADCGSTTCLPKECNLDAHQCVSLPPPPNGAPCTSNGSSSICCNDVCCAAAPANGTPICSSDVCGFTCDRGYTECGQTCVKGKCGKQDHGGADQPPKMHKPMRGNVQVIGYGPGEVDHKGRDLWAVDFTSNKPAVYPTAAGMVVFVGWNCQTMDPNASCCYGNTVAIDHGGGYYSIYTHLAPDGLPQQSTPVTTNTAIGTMSDSGCPGGGLHLHFAMHHGDDGLKGTDALFSPTLTAVRTPWR